MNLSPDDLQRLTHEVRRFLSKGDLMTRLATRARLYLEFPDVGSMHNAEVAIMQALGPMMYLAPGANPTTVDEGTIEIEFGGMTIMLTCKQRFMTPSGKAVGYGSMEFKEWPSS